jgi:hypothetical protein
LFVERHIYLKKFVGDGFVIKLNRINASAYLLR